MKGPDLARQEAGLSVVIPVYNGDATVPDLVSRLHAALPVCSTAYEIILVNDKSEDSSWSCIRKLAEERQEVRGISLMRNSGQQNALLCGIRVAQHDTIVCMDDDLQHSPEDIPKLIAKLDEGYDVVYGIPRNLPHAWWRNITATVAKRIIGIVTDSSYLRKTGGFMAFRAGLRKAFEGYHGQGGVIEILLSWGTSAFGSVEVDYRRRQSGRSGYNFRKLVDYAMRLLTGMNTVPLRFASVAGLFFMLGGVGVLLYALVAAACSIEVNTSSLLTVGVVLLASGVQLLCVGIIGEYLARMYTQALDRPAYTVMEDTDPSAGAT